jgi:hypothetical protein
MSVGLRLLVESSTGNRMDRSVAEKPAGESAHVEHYQQRKGSPSEPLTRARIERGVRLTEMSFQLPIAL